MITADFNQIDKVFVKSPDVTRAVRTYSGNTRLRRFLENQRKCGCYFSFIKSCLINNHEKYHNNL